MSLITKHDVFKLLYHLSQFNKKFLLKYRIKCHKIHLICEIIYSSGWPLEDIACLRIHCVNLDKNYIRYRGRISIFNNYIKDILSIYMNEIRDKSLGDYLFFSPGGCTYAYVDKYIKRICLLKKISIVTTKDIAKALPMEFLRLGCSCSVVEEIFKNNGLIVGRFLYLKNLYNRYNTRRYRSLLLISSN